MLIPRGRYWLGNQDNSSSSTGATYPSHQRVREAMAIVVAMGGNTIRSNSLGISTGSSYSLLRSKGNYNAAAWEPIDYAVYAAKQYGDVATLTPLQAED